VVVVVLVCTHLQTAFLSLAGRWDGGIQGDPIPEPAWALPAHSLGPATSNNPPLNRDRLKGSPALALLLSASLLFPLRNYRGLTLYSCFIP
jgi:hypothetical protein